jgi:hypothetical protein
MASMDVDKKAAADKADKENKTDAKEPAKDAKEEKKPVDPNVVTLAGVWWMRVGRVSVVVRVSGQETTAGLARAFVSCPAQRAQSCCVCVCVCVCVCE